MFEKFTWYPDYSSDGHQILSLAALLEAGILRARLDLGRLRVSRELPARLQMLACPVATAR